VKALVYYLCLPLIYLISLLPFWLLYWLSNSLFVLVYYIFGYRKQTICTNLRNSFPEKSEAEIQALAKSFTKYFCDLSLETLKTLTISPAQLKKRVKIRDLAVLERYFEQQQSVLLVMGHFGNWELAGARFAQEKVHKLYVIYHPLSNEYFDALFYKMRTRLGNRLYSMKESVRGILKNRDKVTATALIADQSPSPKNAYWTEFLHQETPVFTGTEKIAVKMNYPVIYVSVKRPTRGFYTVDLELLSDNPGTTQENEISELHTRRLEQDIREQPEIWLWSHRRWKHKRAQSS